MPAPIKPPNCNRCGTWFSTTRRGPIDANPARQLAALVGVEPPGEEEDASAAYRLFACNGGCGPTGFELRFEGSGGGPAKAWLDAEGRNQVVATLDKRIVEG